MSDARWWFCLGHWLPEIIAYFETGTTNAATEGCNRKVKQVKRVACGLLLELTWP